MLSKQKICIFILNAQAPVAEEASYNEHEDAYNRNTDDMESH